CFLLMLGLGFREWAKVGPEKPDGIIFETLRFVPGQKENDRIVIIVVGENRFNLLGDILNRFSLHAKVNKGFALVLNPDRGLIPVRRFKISDRLDLVLVHGLNELF